VQHRQRAVVAAIAVAVLAALLVIGQRRRGDDDARAAGRDDGARADTASTTAARRGQPIIRVDGPPETDLSPEKIQRVLDDYRRDAIYPHWSRPLEPEDEYKLHWNRAITSDLDMDERPGHETLYRFDADRTHVGYAEAFTSWIEVFRKGERSKRVPIRIHAASVNAVGGDEQGKMIDLVYRDDGTGGDAVAGDLVYTNRFVPSEHEELRTSRLVQIQANVEAEGGATRAIVREFTYAPRPTLEVERVTDAIVDGHLAVTLHVEVFEAGTYTVEANCFAADGTTPIAYVREFAQLAAGKQQVTVKFFGKIFHDKGFDGPYVIRDVRGFLRFLDSGEMPIWFMWPHEHRTAPYPRAQLDPDEWDDPEKRARIQGYEELLEQAKGR
jgi:hypothetical protein